MGFDIISFKSAFGYNEAVVGKLDEVLRGKLKEDPTNQQLATLSESVALQSKLLEKSQKIGQLKSEPQQDFRIELQVKSLSKEVNVLKIDPKLDTAKSNLELLEELYTTEIQLSSATQDMQKELLGRKARKVRTALQVPETFTTLGGDTEKGTAVKGPSLEQVRRGGGEMEIGAKFTVGNKTYTVDRAIAGGGHSGFKLIDEKGEASFWKPSEGDTIMHGEIGGSQLATKLMPGLVPPCQLLQLGDKKGAVQPWVVSDEKSVRLEELTETQREQMIAHMVSDFLISNHDNHIGQFFFDKQGNVIGFDKGQAFKHFSFGGVDSAIVKAAKAEAEKRGGKAPDQLRKIEPQTFTPGYTPPGNGAPSIGKDLMRTMQTGLKAPDLTQGPIAAALETASKLTIEDVRRMLGEYAKLAFPGEEEAFFKAVVERAHGLKKQVAELSLSAPQLVDQHTKALDGILDGKHGKPGSFLKIGQELESLREAIRTLGSNKQITDAKPPEGKEPSPEYQLKLKLDELKEKLNTLQGVQDDCQACERYLSSEYQSISPLLGAFEKLGIPASVHNDPEYKLDDQVIEKLLPVWRDLAEARTKISKKDSAGWDKEYLKERYEVVRSMSRAWQVFPEPEVPGGKVARGDIADNLAANYPALDVSKLENGEHNSSFTIGWPGPMSTTIGDVKTHSYTAEKTFLWDFTVATPCPGRVIGDINPSEQEITFPIGVKVQVKKLKVEWDRTGEKPKAKVQAIATLG